MTTDRPNPPKSLSWLRVAVGAGWPETSTGRFGFRHAISREHACGSLETIECADTASLVRGNFDIRILMAPGWNVEGWTANAMLADAIGHE